MHKEFNFLLLGKLNHIFNGQFGLALKINYPCILHQKFRQWKVTATSNCS